MTLFFIFLVSFYLFRLEPEPNPKAELPSHFGSSSSPKRPAPQHRLIVKSQIYPHFKRTAMGYWSLNTNYNYFLTTHFFHIVGQDNSLGSRRRSILFIVWYGSSCQLSLRSIKTRQGSKDDI